MTTVGPNNEAYPKRSSHFAHKAIRLLGKTCAAQDIGPEACWLVTVIAHTEDAKRYRGPVTFYNEQLLPLCGFGGKSRLVRARGKAVTAGWLHYESGGKGVPGRYWTLVPDAYQDLPDGPIDESSDRLDVPKRDDKPTTEEQSSPKTGRQPDGKRDDNRTANAPLSSLDLFPNPNPEKSAPAGAGLPGKLIELIDGWNGLKPDIVKPGNGVRREQPAKAILKGWAKAQRDRELRAAFEDIPKLLAAIRKAKFCHGEGWFTLPWLFGKNGNGEWKAVNLINGGYDNAKGNGKPGRTELPTGAGHSHGVGRVDVSGFE